MIRELQSKLTSRIHIVDEETYQQLKKTGDLKKFNVVKEHQKKVPIPEELIKKSTKTEQKIFKSEEKTLNKEDDK